MWKESPILRTIMSLILFTSSSDHNFAFSRMSTYVGHTACCLFSQVCCILQQNRQYESVSLYLCGSFLFILVFLSTDIWKDVWIFYLISIKSSDMHKGITVWFDMLPQSTFQMQKNYGHAGQRLDLFCLKKHWHIISEVTVTYISSNS